MFNLIPTFTNNLTSSDNYFKSIFDVFNEPFFQNAFAPVNSMFNAFKVDVKDTDNAYELTAELPGVKKENIALDYQNGYLTIKATMQNEQNQNEASNYIHQERYYGTMQRSFYVGQIDKANAKAEYTDGVLKMTLPKLQPQSTTTQIDID